MNSRLMTGSRVGLAVAGASTAPRRSVSKRRKLEDGDDDDGEDGEDADDDVAVGPSDIAHQDAGEGRPPPEAATPATVGHRRQSHCVGGFCEDWWPTPLAWNLPDDDMSLIATSPSTSSRTGARLMASVRRSSCGPVSAADPSDAATDATDAADEAGGNSGNSLQECSQMTQADRDETDEDWSELPVEMLAGVFKLLTVQDLGRCAQVCRGWRRATQEPCLWRRADFVLGKPLRPLWPEPTPPALVNFILEEHAQHLKFVVLRTDNSTESARSASRILGRLVKCSLKTLALMSGAASGAVGRPSLLEVEQRQFAAALTLVLDHSSPSLRALAIDHTLVDDPALRALAGDGSQSANSLQLLRCKNCPRLSPEGVLALVGHCRSLRELSVSYSLLSDGLLHALSSDSHVRLELLRVDVFSNEDSALQAIEPNAWHALVKHSPQLNLVMYLFSMSDESFDNLFASYIPVTHLYFGDYVPASIIGRVADCCPRLVELVVGANGDSIIDQQLLDIAAKCQQLSSLGLAECQVTYSALVRLAELCGPRLAQLVVMEECLIEDDSAYDQAATCARVSQILGREWNPEFMPMW